MLDGVTLPNDQRQKVLMVLHTAEMEVLVADRPVTFAMQNIPGLKGDVIFKITLEADEADKKQFLERMEMIAIDPDLLAIGSCMHVALYKPLEDSDGSKEEDQEEDDTF